MPARPNLNPSPVPGLTREGLARVMRSLLEMAEQSPDTLIRHTFAGDSLRVSIRWNTLPRSWELTVFRRRTYPTESEMRALITACNVRRTDAILSGQQLRGEWGLLAVTWQDAAVKDIERLA